MKNIEEIMSLGSPTEIYSLLTSNKKPFVKQLSETEREYNPYLHKVMDINIRKKKTIKVDSGRTDENGRKIWKEKKVERCRISIPAQKVLVERLVGFLFSNPVEYKLKGTTDDLISKAHDSVMQVFDDNKIEYFDKRLARTLFRERECAELWYYELDGKGQPSKMKIKLLSPTRGDSLFPHFNDFGDMDGFARKYTVYEENGESKNHFDVYDREFVYKFTDYGTGMASEGEPKRHGFTKIPVIYYRQEKTEWDDVQIVIERIEELLSNWGDINDYYGSPSYFAKGKLSGFADKGEVGRVYTSESGEGDMKVLSWDSSPQSMSTELANLFNIVFSYTQTPDISFENMKTLGGNTSGVAIQLMFTDPHMKANIKIEIFGELHTRRYNVVLNGLETSMNIILPSTVERMRVKPVYHIFLPKNDLETIQMLSLSNGGKPSMSQESSVRKNPMVDEPESDIKDLKQAAQAEQIMNAFGSAQ